MNENDVSEKIEAESDISFWLKFDEFFGNKEESFYRVAKNGSGNDRLWFKLGFKAAALPLHNEIQELRHALTWTCGMLDHFRRFDKVDEYREQFKLDEAPVKT